MEEKNIKNAFINNSADSFSKQASSTENITTEKTASAGKTFNRTAAAKNGEDNPLYTSGTSELPS